MPSMVEQPQRATGVQLGALPHGRRALLLRGIEAR